MSSSHFSASRTVYVLVGAIALATTCHRANGFAQENPGANVGTDESEAGKRREKAGSQPAFKPVPTGDVVRANLEPSYLAYPVPIMGLSPLIFESNVVAHFFVNHPEWPFAFVLAPKIVVRMYREASAPVRSPSYMPRMMLFFWFQKEVRDAPALYTSLMLSHHSNGQSGPFFTKDGSINHMDGSFSTNYFEFSLYGTGFSGPWFGWSALSLEWHPGFNENPELRGRYGLWRVHFASTILANLPLKGQVNLRLSGILDGFSRSSHTPWVRALERFPLALRYSMSPPGVDLGLYVSYYFGHDYYNIYFDRLVHMIQIGISGGASPSLFDDRD